MEGKDKKERIIDLSLTVDPSATWIHFPIKQVFSVGAPKVEFRKLMTVKDNGVLWYSFEMTTQDFTHVDVPNHFIEGGMACDEVPLENFVGEAVVIDMTHKKPGELIVARDLEESGVDVRKGDILILRTGWTDKTFGTEKFWSDAIGMDLDVGDWIIEKEVKTLVTDFYTDIPPLRRSKDGTLEKAERPRIRNHHKLLGAGICLVDFCCNLTEIKKPRVKIFAMPIKMKGTDGAPARVIAIEEI
jgi:kynurenine formamidase